MARVPAQSRFVRMRWFAVPSRCPQIRCRPELRTVWIQSNRRLSVQFRGPGVRLTHLSARHSSLLRDGSASDLDVIRASGIQSQIPAPCGENPERSTEIA